MFLQCLEVIANFLRLGSCENLSKDGDRTVTIPLEVLGFVVLAVVCASELYIIWSFKFLSEELSLLLLWKLSFVVIALL
jgi:hypothetical protein